MYTWKINMKNGDKFIVESNICNSNEFINEILANGRPMNSVNVTHYKLTKDNLYEGYRSNWVAILSTEVSSVEYLGK